MSRSNNDPAMTTVHEHYCAVGHPLKQDDVVQWIPDGPCYRVTSAGGLCTVRPAASAIDYSLRLVTRRLLHLPPGLTMDDATVVACWRKVAIP